MKLNNNTKKKNGGFVISSELILIATVLVIGLITGLHGLRSEVNEELLDVAQAIGAVDQSYSYTGLDVEETGTDIAANPGNAAVSGSGFDDAEENVRTDVLAPQLESATGITGVSNATNIPTSLDDNDAL